MQSVEKLDQGLYKVQLSDETQKIIDTLCFMFGVPDTEVVMAMLKFAECMAVSRIINEVEKQSK